jgi:hypothetical protein
MYDLGHEIMHSCRRRSLRRWAVSLVALIAIAMATACDEDDPPLDQLQIQLVSSNDTRPFGPAQVSIFDLVESRYVASFEVGADGLLDFRPTLAGDYVPVVHAPGFEVFFLPQPRFTLRRRGRTISVVIPMRPDRTLADFGVRLAGQVVDATTGLPIENAQVEMTSIEVRNPFFTEYRGSRSGTEPITDADGRFVIERVPMVLIAGEADLFTTSFRVRASGYRSFARAGWAESDVPGNFLVELEPGQDDGLISGRVVDRDGAPVAGVPVRAEWRVGAGILFREAAARSPFDRDVDNHSSILTNSRGVSAADGRFLLEGLPRGGFVVLAGPEPQDGFWPSSPDPPKAILEADSAGVDVGDIEVAPAVILRAPRAGAELVEFDVALSWAPFAGASTYSVSLGRGDGAFSGVSTDTTNVSLSGDSNFLQAGAWYTWTVFAWDDQGQIISKADYPRLFRLLSPPMLRE